MRSALIQNPVIRFLASIKLTVVCLVFLFILVFWGTVYQTEYGLYLAQERFFQSFVILIQNVIPFPGGQLVMWVLFINLALVAIFYLEYTWSKLGNIVAHFGLLLFFVAGFATFHLCKDSALTLYEQQSSNVSMSYQNWELAVWTKEGVKRDVIAYNSDRFLSGETITFPEYGFNLRVETYYPNCNAYAKAIRTDSRTILNSSGIKSLRKLPFSKEPEKNFPGGTFIVQSTQETSSKILLYGQDSNPTTLKLGEQTYYLSLRRQRFELPFTVKLLDFRMDVHPGTQMASRYESEVDIQTPQMSRRSVISMNNPLRYKDYTFYQSSYSIDQAGREISTLAVVKNTGRILPYVASLTTFAGLVLHFGIAFGKAIQKKRNYDE